MSRSYYVPPARASAPPPHHSPSTAGDGAGHRTAGGTAGGTALSLRPPPLPSLAPRAAKRDTSGGASPPELARPRSRGGPTNVTVGFAAWGGRSRAGCGSLLVMIKEEQWHSEEET
jgi:hypothetical protein